MKCTTVSGCVLLLWLTFINDACALSITNAEYSGGNAVLTWAPVPGKAYTIQYKTTLAQPVWRVPPRLDYPVLTNRWADPETNTSRFFRLIAAPAGQRGKLISGTAGLTLGFVELNVLFALAGIPLTPQYPVVLHKVTYETVDPLGSPTVASGAVVLPLNAPGPLPLFTYQHGTIVQPSEAPSAMNLAGEILAGAAMACAGYAAVLPDYLGLGDSTGPHFYHHARSQATAAIDMLRAAHSYIATQGIPLNDKLFISGYSQGGHAALSLLRELETFHTNEFHPTACAAMAGAYDLSGSTANDVLAGRPQPNPYYFLYLLNSYQEVYGLAPTLADVFVPPYDSTLPPLIAAKASSSQINAAMPGVPSQALNPEFFAAFRDDLNHPLRLALQDNDLYRWTPRTLLRLYHCSGDKDVVYANSEVAFGAFKANGAVQVELIDPLPGGDHGTCVEPSMLHAKAWFDQLR